MPKKSAKIAQPKPSSAAKRNGPPIDTVVKTIREKYGKDKAMLLLDGAEALSEVTEVIPTGIDVLDHYIIGCGGLPVKRLIELYSVEGGGKAQPMGATVMTPFGARPIGDLSIGDVISNPDGGMQQVTGVFPQGEKEVFEIEVSDGGKTRCCGDHLWRLFTSSDCSRKTGGRVVSLNEILQKGLREPHGKWATWRWRLPDLQPVEFADYGEELPLDPYLLGLLLGDGGFASGGTVRFHKPEPDLWAKIASLLPPGDSITEMNDGSGIFIVGEGGKGHARSKTAQAIERMGLMELRSFEKFVPEAYAIAANPIARLLLLRGLCDSDGHVHKADMIEYSTSSLMLADAVVFIARSIGCVAPASSRIPTYSYLGEKKKGKLAYRVYLRSNGEALVTSNKHVAALTGRAWPVYRSITSVRSVGIEECVCISVSGKSQTYITDDFIVTHNTALTYHCLGAAQRAGGIAILIVSEEFNRERAETMGVNVDELVLLQPDYMEQVGDMIADAVRSLSSDIGPILVAWDSIAATPGRREIEEGIDGKDKVGERSKLLSKACRTFGDLLKKHRLCLLFVNQVRDNIGVMFGDDFVTPGGHAVKFLAGVRLQLIGGKAVKDGDLHEGKDPILMATKNKVGPPWRKARVRLNFKAGWDNEWSTLNHAMETEIMPGRSHGRKAYLEAMTKLGWKVVDEGEPEV